MSMQWIRVTAATAFLLGSLSTAAMAQGRPDQRPNDERHRHRGQHHDPERRLQHLRERLNLDEHQVAIIRETFQRMHSERVANRPATRPSRDEMRARHEAFRARMTSEIDAVLTPQQREAFARMRAEHEARRAARREGREGRGDHDNCERGPNRDPV